MTNNRAFKPAIDVIIVNYRTRPFVEACLSSLAVERENLPGLRVVLVDNNSGDGSFEALRMLVDRRGWDWVVPLQSGHNGGFGAGNNFALDWIQDDGQPAEFVWLLNPDTRVVPGASAALIRFMKDHPAAGLAGSALLEGDGAPWPFAFRFPSILGEIERGARWGLISRLLRRQSITIRMGERCEKVDWVSGASLVIRRDLIDHGLRFDEGYFLYYEETDLCLTAKRLGWECWYVPQAVVLHIAGQSTGLTGKQAVLQRLPTYWFHSRRRYFVKNHGRFYGVLADLGWLVAYLLARAKQSITKAPQLDPPNLLTDFVRHSALLSRQ